MIEFKTKNKEVHDQIMKENKHMQMIVTWNYDERKKFYSQIKLFEDRSTLHEYFFDTYHKRITR